MKKTGQLKNKLSLTFVCVAILLIFWIFKIPCLNKAIFGMECIGCGMSRAYFSLLRLDFAAAFSYHPMFWSVPVVYVYFLFDGKLFGRKYLDTAVIVTIVLGFLINWLLKIF